MIYKATLGAYQWALKSTKVDTTKIFSVSYTHLTLPTSDLV